MYDVVIGFLEVIGIVVLFVVLGIFLVIPILKLMGR